MTPEEITAMQAENAALKAAATKPPVVPPTTPPPEQVPPKKEETDLAEKARLEREAKDKGANDTKKIQDALKFTMGSDEWLKTNKSLLPVSIEGIFAQANKETYENEIQKASAIKVGLISEFFAQQANLELLTGPQKLQLDEFLKLTKNVKEERAQSIYESVFEPTFESLKRIKKAQQVREGIADPDDAQSVYANRMMEISKKKFIRKGVK